VQRPLPFGSRSCWPSWINIFLYEWPALKFRRCRVILVTLSSACQIFVYLALWPNHCLIFSCAVEFMIRLISPRPPKSLINPPP